MCGIKIKHTFFLYTFENGRRGAPLSIFKYRVGGMTPCLPPVYAHVPYLVCKELSPDIEN